MLTKEILAIILGIVAIAGVTGGAVNRFQLRKGIGAQFIRYNTIVIALPMAGSLALLGMLSEAMVTIVTGALGYAFAGFGAKD